MPLYTLKNEFLEVSITEIGAELQSIRSLADGHEYLWDGKPEYWNRRSPVLFPIVGRLKNDSYTYKGLPYSLGQHGFARSRTFTLVGHTDTAASFVLREDAETLAQYPFAFALTIGYELVGKTVHVTYHVHNPAAGDLLFSIGAHPGFTFNATESEERHGDYDILFDRLETAARLYLDAGLRNGKSAVALNNTHILRLQRGSFSEDAFVFKGLKSHWVALLHKRSNRRVTVHAVGFPYLGIWSKADPDGDFVCIEPWHGIADSIDSTGRLEDKDGMIRLSPDAHIEYTYGIEIS